MNTKIIDYFYIDEKSSNGKDYVATEYKIDTPYRLRVGDKLKFLRYWHRGYIEHDTTIIDINERGITVTSRYGKENKFVPWIEESKEARILEFVPFPVFNPGINKKTFKKITRTLDDFTLCDVFGVSRTLQIDELKPYLKNFNNVNPTQETEIKILDTEDGQYRFSI